MRWRWNRKQVASTAAVVSVPAVVATLALVNPGFPLAQVDLNDGAVWLTSTSTLQVGRYNAQVEELNAGLTSTSAEFDVLQEAGNVLIVEPGMVSVMFETSETAAVFYTLDGTAPTFESAMYGAAGVREAGETLVVPAGTTIHWFSVDSAGNVERNYKPDGSGKNFSKITVK